jgi:type I restriction enzyme S subunit
MRNPIIEHFDIWTAAQSQKITSAGRRNNSTNHTSYGINKLRELILELAVHGKLVPQDPKDQPASVLLKNLSIEKERLIKAGEIKKHDPIKKVSEVEKPFDLPNGWEWARLPEVCTYKPGKTPSTKNPIYWSDNVADIPWVSISDMNNFGLITNTKKRITQIAIEHVFKYNIIPRGTLLMSFKLTVGKISILDVDAYHNEAIISILPFIGMNRDYLFKFLPNRALAGNTKSAIMGDTLNATSLSLLMIPIPPKAEQDRIVTKVDELMNLCDQLEQQQNDNNALHQILIRNLLVTLIKATNQDEFAEAWQRIAKHFDTLFTTEYSIDQIKQTILQLAVMGKLVRQDPNDEPASELLKMITKEKIRLVNKGKLKKEKLLPKINEALEPFKLPNGWEFVRLGDITNKIGSGSTPHGGKNIYVESGIPLLRSQNVWTRA